MDASLPSYIDIRHLLSIEMGSCPVAFRVSLAFLYSLAIAALSLGVSSF